MNILGIIAEYNPFHNGHQYHLQKSKDITQVDGTICVMSGNFLQRGEPSLLDKWERTKMALAGGIDLVIELPIPYALRSAEFFAYGGITLLDATKVVNYISFGSESGELEKLNTISKILAKEPEELKQFLRFYLDQGLSFPSARTQALIDHIQQKNGEIKLNSHEIESLTSNPNNILALEYLKAIHRLSSDLIPVTIPRIAASFHDTSIQGKIASATAIRENLLKKVKNNEPITEQIMSTIPQSSQIILTSALSQKNGPVSIEDFAPQILTLLRRAKVESLANLFDVRGGLENRIKEASKEATSIQELIRLIKTKRYTWTRIQRIIFHYLINLTSVECEYFDQLGGPQYIRVLGFNKRGQKILAHMKEKANLPIITRIANHLHRPHTPEPINRMLEFEILATDLYSLAIPNPKYRHSNRDLLERVVIVK